MKRGDLLFLHSHPYPPFVPPGATRLIVGTLPPPRFSGGVLRPGDVDFCYGSADNLLWPILAEIYRLTLRYDNSTAAVDQRREFLASAGIGICDMVACRQRQQVSAADLGMEHIQLRDLLGLLAGHPGLKTLLFVGGSSKNGPEYLFRRQLKEAGLRLEPVRGASPRRHYFHHAGRRITTVSLVSPSSAANRAIGGNPYYKLRKAEDAGYSPFTFRVEQYRKIFLQRRGT